MNLSAGLIEPLRSSRSIAVLERAVENGRLAHAILLQGNSLEAIEAVARALAATLLDMPEGRRDHPDLFVLRPSHKARFIRIEATRELTRKIQHSPHQGHRKVAIICEADRLNISAANAFLKTLEEPPANTTIILISSRPYDLLETIRSRCFHLRVPTPFSQTESAAWSEWLASYCQWLQLIRDKKNLTRNKAAAVLVIFGLITKFRSILNATASERWASERKLLPAGLPDEEKDAWEAGARKGVRHMLFTEIEMETRRFALANGSDRINGETVVSLNQAIAELEHVTALFAVNLDENVALEIFLLSSLRIWTAAHIKP
jgi:DNA polymerase-3 subunit delta'